MMPKHAADESDGGLVGARYDIGKFHWIGR